MSPPRLHSTPPDAVKETVRETVLIDGHAFKINRPGGERTKGTVFRITRSPDEPRGISRAREALS